MTPERWQQITKVFEEAMQRDAAGRVSFLAEACAGDEELLREVEEMLVSHEQADNFIGEPAMMVAARLAAM